MWKKATTCFVFLFFFVGFLFAQSPSRIQRVFEKGDYPKTRDLILKSIEKDSVNVAAKYFNSLLFLLDPFRQNTDSARWFINSAIDDFSKADEGMLNDLEKTEISEDTLNWQKLEVTKEAFMEAKAVSTVASMDYFLRYYPDAPQKQRVIFMRDSLAYNETRKENTWQAYLKYTEYYPESTYYDEAMELYHKLLYEEQTHDNKLTSYINFLKSNPKTPYRNDIELKILQRTTIHEAWENFISFITEYPETIYRKMVIDILYYLDKEKGYDQYDLLLSFSNNTDSLNMTKTLEWHTLFPVYHEEKYGFLSLTGEEILENQFSGILKDYYCGGINDELLQVTKGGDKQSLITRRGVVLIDDIVGFQDLGSGVLLIEFKDGKRLYHKSGFLMTDVTYEEAEVMDVEWVKTKTKSGYGVISLMGEEILENEYRSIEKQGDFLLIEKEGTFSKTTFAHLEEMVLEDQITLDFDFDDYEVIGDSLLLTYNGNKEALYDSNLDQIIPEGLHQTFTYGAAWYIKKDNGFQIFNRNSETLLNQTFPYMEVNNGWMAIKRTDDWLLLSQHYKVLPMRGLDSIKLINDYTAFIEKGDTLQLIFDNGKTEWLQPDEQVELLRSKGAATKNRAEYIKITSDDYHKILSKDGGFRMDGRFDDLDFLTDSLLVFTKKDKKGIVDINGEEVLGAYYDAIDEKEGLISLLDDGELGCYNPRTKTRIPTKYETVIAEFGDYFIITSEGGKGLIDQENEEITPAVYSEFKAWNDTSFWAKDTSGWALLTYSQEEIMDGMSDLTTIAEVEKETFLKILKDQNYGVLSNSQGVILEPGYNDIVNVGTMERPVFFAEQHLETASIFVVTYFDKKGETIRSQAYRPEEYDRIYCDL